MPRFTRAQKAVSCPIVFRDRPQNEGAASSTSLLVPCVMDVMPNVKLKSAKIARRTPHKKTSSKSFLEDSSINDDLWDALE